MSHDPTEGLPPKKRFSFSYQFGKVKLKGNGNVSEKLKKAIFQNQIPFSFPDSEREEKESLFLTHLFHSYAARTHPLIVRSLLEDLQPGQVVLDPFVGSGTTLIEANLRGGKGIGFDISEFSIRLSRFKATRMPSSMRMALKKAGEQIVISSLERVQRQIRPMQKWDKAHYYESHIYKELCGLREEIELIRTQDKPLYECILLIFSSLIIKASNQQAESNMNVVRRKIGKGQITRWFQGKLDEVIRLHALFEKALPTSNYSPKTFQMDARDLMNQNIILQDSVDVILTSPPYLGVYNYLDHQIRRSAWLELDTSAILKKEIGSRREYQKQNLAESQKQYQIDTNTWVRGIKKVLRPHGSIYVVVGDSYYDKELIDGSIPICNAMEQEQFSFVASCSVERFYPGREGQVKQPSLWDHILCFKK